MSERRPKKLIEVALPLPEINDASAYDKMPGIGPHPKGIHHWWARLPLPTARAVLFASVVDDPAEHPEKWPSEEEQNAERERLFELIRQMMGKQLHKHPKVFEAARAEMLQHSGGQLPPVFDPFAGGGTIPLEANRLGFETHGQDLNPVAVLLNKCNLEIASRWIDRPPVNRADRQRIGGTESWHGTHGLAADIRYYGNVVRERALSEVGSLYPRVRVRPETEAPELSATAWIWTRTVASPDPSAQGKHVPLSSTFMLSTNSANTAWVEVLLDPSAKDGWRPEVRTCTLAPESGAKARQGTKAGKALDFICALTGSPIPRSYIQAEGKAGRLGKRLMAIVADGGRRKLYLTPTIEHEKAAECGNEDTVTARSTFLSAQLPTRAEITGGVCTAYGLNTWGHLFEDRQLRSLLALANLVRDVGTDVRHDAGYAGMTPQDADDYSRAIVTFLAMALDRCADFNNSLCRWKPSGQQSLQLFARQALPMVWDFVEPHILGVKAVCWHTAVGICADAAETIATNASVPSDAFQADAALGSIEHNGLLVSTDPPYYDNISYGTLSDFFYIWLRRTIGKLYPEIFSTVLVPKLPELIASPDRFGGSRTAAREHFESGFRRTFVNLRDRMDPRYPLTVYYR